MGQIRGNLQASLQSGNDMIVPGTVIETDLANGSVSLEKLLNKDFIYTISMPITHPLWKGVNCVNSITYDAVGWSSFVNLPGVGFNTFDLFNFVVPYASYLVRVDFSVTNPSELLATQQVTFNFSYGPINVAPPASYKLTQGLIVKGASSTAFASYKYGPKEESVPEGTLIYGHITEIPDGVKGMLANFTFKTSLMV